VRLLAITHDWLAHVPGGKITFRDRSETFNFSFFFIITIVKRTIRYSQEVHKIQIFVPNFYWNSFVWKWLDKCTRKAVQNKVSFCLQCLYCNHSLPIMSICNLNISTGLSLKHAFFGNSVKYWVNVQEKPPKTVYSIFWTFFYYHCEEDTCLHTISITKIIIFWDVFVTWYSSDLHRSQTWLSFYAHCTSHVPLHN